MARNIASRKLSPLPFQLVFLSQLDVLFDHQFRTIKTRDNIYYLGMDGKLETEMNCNSAGMKVECYAL
jgi:hypothetical protein